MPYPRHSPVPEDEMEITGKEELMFEITALVDTGWMDKRRFEGHHSVCQQLRDIYHMTDNLDIKLKCRLAMSMTKSMNEKLKWYKANEQEKTI